MQNGWERWTACQSILTGRRIRRREGEGRKNKRESPRDPIYCSWVVKLRRCALSLSIFLSFALETKRVRKDLISREMPRVTAHRANKGGKANFLLSLLVFSPVSYKCTHPRVTCRLSIHSFFPFVFAPFFPPSLVFFLFCFFHFPRAFFPFFAAIRSFRCDKRRIKDRRGDEKYVRSKARVGFEKNAKKCTCSNRYIGHSTEVQKNK